MYLEAQLVLPLFIFFLADVAFEQAGMRFLEFFHDVSLSVTSVYFFFLLFAMLVKNGSEPYAQKIYILYCF